MFHVEQINKSRKMFYVEQSRGEQKRALRPFEAVEKVAFSHFFEFFHPVLAPMARSAPNVKYENLWVFIRSDAHVVRAGLNIRGCGPLSTLGFFRQTQRALRPFVSYCLTHGYRVV